MKVSCFYKELDVRAVHSRALSHRVNEIFRVKYNKAINAVTILNPILQQ